jgi:hypothetical protein
MIESSEAIFKIKDKKRLKIKIGFSKKSRLVMSSRHFFILTTSYFKNPTAFKIQEDFIPANKQDVYVLPGLLFCFLFSFPA